MPPRNYFMSPLHRHTNLILAERDKKISYKAIAKRLKLDYCLNVTATALANHVSATKKQGIRKVTEPDYDYTQTKRWGTTI